MLEQNRMSEEQFTNISMAVLFTGLILFMGFIIWDLGKKSPTPAALHVRAVSQAGFGVTGFLQGTAGQLHHRQISAAGFTLFCLRKRYAVI